MSSVKKLSLSGFKSTFKRKSSRGISRNNVDTTASNGELQHGNVCDNETSKTNDEYQNIPTQNGPGNVKTEGIVPPNKDESGRKTRGMKTSRWGFRQKSDGKSKICENGNEKITTLPECEPGSGVHLDHTADDDDSALPTCNPPSANGHIVINNQNMNGNETGYIGARCISSSHSFQEVDNSTHHYINDVKSKKNEKTEALPDECGTENQESVRHGRYNFPLPVPSEKHCDNEVRGINSMRCDVNDNAEIFEERLDECLENDVACMKDDESVPSEEDRPAIPPKPASLYCNGQWQLQGADSVRSKNKKNSTISLGEEQDLPPRPPARSKTRHGVDMNLPFYKQYLELKEKSGSQTVPIYEDVRVELGFESGGLAGELSKLPRQPWYWGPMSQDEAEGKLDDADDGSFLVRDSSDDRYLLTLSFKSNGRTLHTRIEHRNGLFSLNDSEGHASVIELIENAVKESQGGVFGYMNDSTGIQNFPARLTQWVSRYSEVKSLQYLCRFVIRETYPRHHIRHLPLPKKINEYILENQY